MFKIKPYLKCFTYAAIIMLFLLSLYVYAGEVEQRNDNAMPDYLQHQGIGILKDTPFYEFSNSITDEQLKELINKMFSYNRNIKQMLATVKRLYAEYSITRSALYPKLGFNTSVGIVGVGVSEGSYNYNDYQVSMPVSYEIDVWQRLKSQSKAALLESEAASYDRQALSVTLTAELIERYYAGLYLLEQLSLLDDAIGLTTQASKLLNYKYDAGVISKDEVYKNEQTLKNLSVQQALVKSQIVRIEHSLKVLIGEYPQDGWLKGKFAVPVWLEDVPVGLPSELVQRRPDLHSIQSRINASDYKIRAAKYASFPSFSLTGDTHSSSDELKKITNGDNLGWGIFAKVSMPVFDGHRNKSAYEAEIFSQQELDEEYNQILLNAFSEVENALSNGKKQEEIVAALRERNDLIDKNLNITKAQYENGLEDLLEVSLEKQKVISAEIELLNSQLQLISYRIQLIRSLSGGWWDVSLQKKIG